MKLWYGYGSEHSMNLVMIGRFKEVAEAEQVKQLIDQLMEKVCADAAADLISIGSSTDRFSEHMLDFLGKMNLHSFSPGEIEQFAYGVTVKLKGNDVVVKTDECDVSAFLKVRLDNGAKVEVFSAHQYPEAQASDGA